MKSAHVFLLLAALTGATTCLILRKHIFVTTFLSWPNAQEYCRNNYVDLSTINTPEELGRFKTDVATYLSVRSWIGLSKRPDQLSFGQWSDGSVFRITQWTGGQPSNPTTEHCTTIGYAAFSDYACENRLPFICYTWNPVLVLVPEMKTWKEALVHCKTQYTDLISLGTETDIFSVNKIKNPQNASVWTGLTFLDGSWFWVNKEPLMDLFLLPSCPIQPFRCGAKVGDNILTKDCMEKMSFICYHAQW